MKKENLFYILIIFTILLTRIIIKVLPEKHIYILGIIIHHFWIGILLIIIGLFITKKNLKILIYSIGVGLFLDELAFILLGGGLNKQYFEMPSIIGMIIFAILIFPLRKRILNLLMNRPHKFLKNKIK